jgi:hypothetical protein
MSFRNSFSGVLGSSKPPGQNGILLGLPECIKNIFIQISECDIYSALKM